MRFLKSALLYLAIGALLLGSVIAASSVEAFCWLRGQNRLANAPQPPTDYIARWDSIPTPHPYDESALGMNR